MTISELRKKSLREIEYLAEVLHTGFSDQKQSRDHLVLLDVAKSGSKLKNIAARIGVSPGRAQQLVARAYAAALLRVFFNGRMTEYTSGYEAMSVPEKARRIEVDEARKRVERAELALGVALARLREVQQR